MTTEMNSEGVSPASYQLASQVALRVLLTADKRLGSCRASTQILAFGSDFVYPRPLYEIGRLYIGVKPKWHHIYN